MLSKAEMRPGRNERESSTISEVTHGIRGHVAETTATNTLIDCFTEMAQWIEVELCQ